MPLTSTINTLVYKVTDKTNKAYPGPFFDVLEILE